MKYFLVAGEASGDLHAAALMKEIKLLDPEAEFRFLGGDLMRAAGGSMVLHYRDMAFMGFTAVIRNLRKIARNYHLCKKALLEYQPDKVILVDYPGFNLRIAKFVFENLQVPVYYYIAPKLWVWKKYRIHAIRKYVHRLITIFPFETEFYRGLDYKVYYAGNPTVDSVINHPELNQSDFRQVNKISDKPVIAVLPGSRKQEISACLPVIMKGLGFFADHEIVVACAPGVEPEFYHRLLKNDAVKLVFNQTYQLVKHADVAVVNSGTATLETALIGTPQVVVYHVWPGRLAALLKKIFLKTKFVSLANIIAGKEVVKELVAHLFKSENVYAEVARILKDESYRENMIDEYIGIRMKLGEPGCARRAASIVCEQD